MEQITTTFYRLAKPQDYKENYKQYVTSTDIEDIAKELDIPCFSHKFSSDEIYGLSTHEYILFTKKKHAKSVAKKLELNRDENITDDYDAVGNKLYKGWIIAEETFTFHGEFR